jgi:hypothetical protein
MHERGSYWTDFREIWYWEDFYENPLRECEFGKIGQNYLALYVEI